MITLGLMTRQQISWAQWVVKRHHYLQSPVDARCSVEGYNIQLDVLKARGSKDYVAGLLLFGRPEATRCGDWYGAVEDVQSGRCEVTRWQVLNLARVWLSSEVQAGGRRYRPGLLPGYTDRRGQFRSTLASEVIKAALDRVRVDYLVARPPCFLDEPYQLEYVLSYCDTRLHKGTIYKAAGFELYRTNSDGIQTWRKRLKPLTLEEDARVRQASEFSPRSQKYRAERQFAGAQLQLSMEVC